MRPTLDMFVLLVPSLLSSSLLLPLLLFPFAGPSCVAALNKPPGHPGRELDDAPGNHPGQAQTTTTTTAASLLSKRDGDGAVPVSELWYPSPEAPAIIDWSDLEEWERISMYRRVMAWGDAAVYFVKMTNRLQLGAEALMLNEVRAYRRVNGFGISPQFRAGVLKTRGGGGGGGSSRSSKKKKKSSKRPAAAVDGFATDYIEGGVMPGADDTGQLERCAGKLARLHGLGLAHGDPWRRNCVVAADGEGEAFIVDLEHSYAPAEAERDAVFAEELAKMRSGLMLRQADSLPHYHGK